jgi:hypothetical protein
MRFVENGPRIPDELLIARDEGRVVFFCGSGVSIARAGLPSFSGLAHKVLDRLHASDSSEARRLLRQQEESEIPGAISADLIFNLLEREFDRPLLGQAVAESLRPEPNADLSAHKIMLALARQADGSVQLVTTNFDRLFEQCDPRLKSVTRSNLPRLQYARDGWGIVNLHGRVTHDYTAPDSDGFVLSSAEFGDAYLAQGWGRDFVRELLDRYIAVFVGYSADDPPVRYLLQGLQRSAGDRHQIYAFQEGPADVATARWDDRGVQAIAYDPVHGHAALWESLKAWSIRAKDPGAWRAKVFSMARRGPAKLAPHQRGMFAHVISTTSGALALRKFNPPVPAEWICVLDPAIRFQEPGRANGRFADGPVVDPYTRYHLDDDPPPRGRNEELSNREMPSEAWDAFRANAEDRRELEDRQLAWARGYHAVNMPLLPRRLAALGDWLGEVALQPAAAWWGGRQSVLHPGFQQAIERKLTPGAALADRPIYEAWRSIFATWKEWRWNDHSGLEVQNAIGTYGWDATVVRLYVESFAPRLKNDRRYTSSLPPSRRRRLTVRDFIRADVEYPKGIDGIVVPDEHLPEAVRLLRGNLERAVALEKEVGGWIRFCAIEPDEGNSAETEFSRSFELSGHVVHFSELFSRLAARDPAAAKAELSCWLPRDPVFSRLRVWAVGIAAIASPEEFAVELLRLNNEEFWAMEFNRDLLVVLARRWAEVPENLRKQVEAKLLQGPPRLRRESKPQHVRRSAHYRLSRLNWLAQHGCNFTFDLNAQSERWRRDAPEWEEEFVAHAGESHDGRSGTVRTDKDWSSLKDVPLSKLLEAARSGNTRRFRDFVEFNPFQGLCEEAPLKAISALALAAKRGEFTASPWETLLSAKREGSANLRLNALLAGRLTKLARPQIAEILLSTSRWFREAGPSLRDGCPPSYGGLWDQLVGTMREAPDQSRSSLIRGAGDIDWATEALNSPAGDLAQLLMTDPLRNERRVGHGFAAEWLASVEELLALPGDSRRFALVMFTFNLHWFFHVDEHWTTENLLSALGGEDNLDIEAFWSGFFWGARTPHAALYRLLKPQLLDMTRKRAILRRRHGEILSGLLLNGWVGLDDDGHRYVSSDELRGALLEADDQFRLHTLWHLERWSKNKKGPWVDQLVPFLTEVWPRQKKARTPQISARLCNLALLEQKNFSEVIEAILPLVGKIDGVDTLLSGIWRAREAPKLPDPEGILKLLHAVLPDDPRHWPYGTGDVLARLPTDAPPLTSDPRLAELLHKWESR